MDLKLRKADLEFQAEVRAFIDRHWPSHVRGDEYVFDAISRPSPDSAAMVRCARGARLVGAELAGRVRRHRLDADAALHLGSRNGARRIARR